MSVMNSETRTAWQQIANDLSAQRPSVGRRVRVTGGRKYLGKVGVVQRHQLSRFHNAFRCASDAQAHMREMAGRSGFCVLVQPEANNEPPFWVDADKVEVL